MSRGRVGSPGNLGEAYIAKYTALGTMSKNSGSRKGPEQSQVERLKIMAKSKC